MENTGKVWYTLLYPWIPIIQQGIICRNAPVISGFPIHSAPHSSAENRRAGQRKTGRKKTSPEQRAQIRGRTAKRQNKKNREV